MLNTLNSGTYNNQYMVSLCSCSAEVVVHAGGGIAPRTCLFGMSPDLSTHTAPCTRLSTKPRAA